MFYLEFEKILDLTEIRNKSLDYGLNLLSISGGRGG